MNCTYDMKLAAGSAQFSLEFCSRAITSLKRLTVNRKKHTEIISLYV